MSASTRSAIIRDAVIDVETELLNDAKRAAQKAQEFQQRGERDKAFRELGIAEGLRVAASKVSALTGKL